MICFLVFPFKRTPYSHVAKEENPVAQVSQRGVTLSCCSPRPKCKMSKFCFISIAAYISFTPGFLIYFLATWTSHKIMVMIFMNFHLTRAFQVYELFSNGFLFFFLLGNTLMCHCYPETRSQWFRSFISFLSTKKRRQDRYSTSTLARKTNLGPVYMVSVTRDSPPPETTLPSVYKRIAWPRRSWP